MIVYYGAVFHLIMSNLSANRPRVLMSILSMTTDPESSSTNRSKTDTKIIIINIMNNISNK